MARHDNYKILGRLYDPMFEPGFSLSGARDGAVAMHRPAPGEEVLDVGFGTGTQLAIYQDLGAVVHGIDRSPTMVEVARKKLGEDADLRQGDATAMPFEDDAFDLVTAMYMLHEAAPEDRQEIAAECARVVKKDGHVVFVDFHDGPYPFPIGWLVKGYILFGEALAGHFANYRQHIASGGLPTLLRDVPLEVQETTVNDDGNTAMALLVAEG